MAPKRRSTDTPDRASKPKKRRVHKRSNRPKTSKAQGINAVDDCTERSTTPRKARLDFLSLPRELRDMIYAHLVLHDHPLILNKPPLEIEKRKYYGRDLEPAVAQTCRQVRDEVVDIFYHRNHFILVAPPDAEWMRALVDEVGERPIASLQRLTVCFVNLKERTNIVPWVQYIEDKLTHLVEVRYDDYNDLGIWFGELVRVYRSLHNDEGLSWAELHRVAAAHAALFPAVLMSDWPVWKDDEAIFPRITYENGYGTIEAYEGNECRRCVLAEQSLQRQPLTKSGEADEHYKGFEAEQEKRLARTRQSEDE